MVETFRQLLKEFPKSSIAAQANYYIGKTAFEAKDYKKAIDYWERLRKRVPPDSDVAQAIDSRINEAKSQMSAGAPKK